MVALQCHDQGEMTAPFPTGIPDNIDDARLIAANDWADFIDVRDMVNHWDRPGWHDGRRSYHWILSFAENAELSAMAKACSPSYSGLAFDQVPLDALHLTVRRVGFTDEVDKDALDTIFARAESLCSGLGDFSLTVGPLAASRGAIRFSVAPWSRLFEIYDLVGTASQSGTGRKSASARDSFRPHIGIAYSRARQDASPLHARVAQYREMSPLTCKVGGIELVELRRESAAYRWDVLRKIDF
jgi:2'-5' RNA ligase